MIEVILVTLLIAISNIVYLIIQLSKVKNRVQILEGSRTTKDIILKPTPERPVLSDIDPGHKTLKDILESIKIENWTTEEVEEEVASYSGPTYSIRLSNPSKTLGARIRLRLRNGYKGAHSPYLANFVVYSLDQNSQRGSLSFDDEHELRNEIILMSWDYITKYHEGVNKNISDLYIKSIDNQEKSNHSKQR